MYQWKMPEGLRCVKAFALYVGGWTCNVTMSLRSQIETHKSVKIIPVVLLWEFYGMLQSVASDAILLQI